jgi:hypothetical protein
MNKLAVFALVSGCAFALPSVAQEHWTEGPVWQIDYYRTKPGKFDDYLKYLRSSVMPQTAELKNQGLNNAQDDAKGKAIAEKHFNTRDENKQQELIAPRFGWRDYLRTSYVREVTLKPLP